MPAPSRLDASAFPHIIDSILSHLCDIDPLTAANLQTVGHSCESVIKRRLFGHIWIAWGGDTAVGCWWPWGTRAPQPVQSFVIGTVPAAAGTGAGAGAGRGPSLRFTLPLWNLPNEHARAAAVDCHPLVVAAVRIATVIDFRCSPSPALLSPEGITVPMLRFVSGSRGVGNNDNDNVSNSANRPPAIDSLVLFEDERNFFGSVVSTEPHRPGAHMCRYQNGTLLLFLMLHKGYVVPETLQNVVVFCPFRGALAYDPQRRCPFMRRDAYHAKLNDCRHIITSHMGRARGKSTTVGTGEGEECSLMVVSPDASSRADPTMASWAYLRQLMHTRPHLLDKVEFLTAAEYRGRVGEDAYRLHTP